MSHLLQRVEKRANDPLPAPGDWASGYGLSGRIAAVEAVQPLRADGIWRVRLEGEAFGRLVRRESHGRGKSRWHLLQLDDLTDEQVDAYEDAIAPGSERPDA